jgi:hypothetical protein
VPCLIVGTHAAVLSVGVCHPRCVCWTWGNNHV